MAWQTPVQLEVLGVVSLKEPILTMGSCFAEHLGEKLSQFKWRCLNNPFGTLFHPLTIAQLLSMSIKGEDLGKDGFVSYDGACFHFDLPSTFYGRDPADLRQRFQLTQEKIRAFFEEPFWILLTLGTAYVYEHRHSKKLVANCHRQAAELYTKRLLNPEEIDAAFGSLAELLPAHARMLWTLSPVRHTRETLPLNMVSKSMLRVWMHQWIQKNPERNFYFPAYEILIDELRDYRYYAADLIHPSEAAIEEIWGRFQACMIDGASRDFVQHWSRILQRLAHRPMRPEAPSYREFLLDSRRLLDEFPGIDVSSEKALLDRQLRAFESSLT